MTTQLKLLLPEWPRLGSVDLAVTWPNADRILVELKCGTNRDSLGPCIWDAAKLALALLRGEGTRAYQLAGAPEASWKRPIRGCELLGDGRWTATEYREVYLDWWRHWEKQADPQPSDLPAAIETVEIGVFPFSVAGQAWELRVSRVATPKAVVPWPSVQTP